MTSTDVQTELKDGILGILSYCINCRFCLPSCPRFEITSGEVSQGASGVTRSLYYAVKWGEEDKQALQELRDIVFGCTTCKSCELACKSLSTGTKLLDAIEMGRELLIEMQVGPMPEQKKVLDSLLKNGNPYMVTARKRKEAVKALGLKEYTDQTEILLYLGCSTAVDEDVQNTVKALAKILDHAGVSYGILLDEACCGEPSLKMGEVGLFEMLSEKNIDLFKDNGVQSIVTLSPHCFETFSSKYPEADMQGIKVRHYTQLLYDLVQEKKLTFPNTVDKKVVYHDPCYLSKYQNVCEEPREVIKSIGGVELMEFKDNRADSLCCGGGGGRMWADFEAETNRLANIRVTEAVEKGAEVLVTACPWCFINMNDGVKVTNAADKLEVLSLAELCAMAL